MAGLSHAELEAEVSRLRLSLDAAGMGWWEWDIAADRITWGGLQERVPGAPPGALAGSAGSLLSLVHPDDRDRIRATMRVALERDEPFAEEFRVTPPEGGVRWVAGKGRLHRDPEGRPLRVAGVVHDVTARRQAEEASQESEQRLTLALAGAGLGTWDWNVATGEVTFDARWTGMLGYAPGELASSFETWQGLVHPEDLPRLLAPLREHLTGRSPVYRAEFRMRARGGEWVWVLSHGQVTDRDARGRALRAVGIHQDITGRKRAEHAQRDSEARLQAILDYTSAVVYVKDLDGRYLLVNRQYERLFGHDRDSVRGKTDADLFAAEHAAAFRVNDRRVLEAGVPLELEEVAPHADGPHTYVSVKFPLRDAAGQPYALCGISTDITERQRVAQALARQAEELEQSNRDLQQFAYAVSHDLQEPLRTVASFTQLLADNYKGKLDADADLFLQYAHEGSVRMRTLIRDLLAYARAGAEQQARLRDRIACEEVLARALDHLRSRLEGSDAEVTHDPLPEVWANPSQLLQVFQNLLSNALKYRRPEVPVRVHVSATLAEGCWTVSVRDNGIGLEPGQARHVFGLFKRLHGREIPGTGLGLALCQRIVERHGGRIWVESRGPGQGCDFRFTLPASPLAAGGGQPE